VARRLDEQRSEHNLRPALNQWKGKKTWKLFFRLKYYGCWHFPLSSGVGLKKQGRNRPDSIQKGFKCSEKLVKSKAVHRCQSVKSARFRERCMKS
jgi:hypothetical protein